MVFGNVGIAPAKGTISNFSIAYASGSVGTINSTSQSLEWSFTLTQDLWKYDMFKLSFDSKFGVESGVTCTSTATSNTAINYYNSSITNSAGNHALDCAETAKTNANTGTSADMEPSYATG